ncbi:MAG: Calx-beta domain-containing protein [Chitinophagales bacterium]
MRKTSLSAHEKLAAYSAFAAAFIAVTNDADASIVYTDNPDITVHIGEYLPIDIDGDTHVDFMLFCTDITPNWSAGVLIGYYTGFSYGDPSNFAIGYMGILPYGSALNEGDLIGPGAGFIPYYTAFLASIYSGATYGAFAGLSDKYLGFQFVTGGALHYGWMRLDATVDPVTLTLKDFAYDDEAGVAIPAGAMESPVPDMHFEAATDIIGEDAGTAHTNVVLSFSADADAIVTINTALSTATAGSDFTFSDPTPVAFTAGGATVYTLDIAIIDDVDIEGPETVVLELTSPTGANIIAPSTFTLTIDDNEAPLPPNISFDAITYSALEGDVLSIDLSASEATDCTVDIAVNAGLSTATEVSDFTYSGTPLTFSAGGDLTQSFTVDITDDLEVEGLENIVFEITGVSGTCIIGIPDATTIEIEDNDVAPTIAEVTFANASITANENAGSLSGNVNLSNSADCSVDVVLSGGTATEGSDFTFDSPLTMTFTEGGVTTASFSVPVNNDAVVEGDETILFTLENASGNCELTTPPGSLQAIIIDDDFEAVQSPDAAGIIVYAFGNTVHIQLPAIPDDHAHMEIFDLRGRSLCMHAISEQQDTYAVQDLPEGNYLVRLHYQGMYFTKMIYIQ